MVEVTQEDRDAAATFGEHRIYSGLGAEGIRNGRADRDELVQAFALHREQAEAAERTRIVAWLLEWSSYWEKSARRAGKSGRYSDAVQQEEAAANYCEIATSIERVLHHKENADD